MPTDRQPTSETASQDATKVVDRSRVITAKALEKIEQLGLRSTPQFYELWYRYFDGDPEIVRVINQHATVLDEMACQKLYNHLLSSQAHDTALHKAGDQVNTSLTFLSKTVDGARAAAAEFGGTLGVAAQKMRSAKKLEDVSDVVTGVIRDTEKMVVRNQELEGQLLTVTSQVAEVKQQLEAARREATTDSLTGIANRKVFDQRIGADIEEASQSHAPLVLLMLDIDHFKKFNDTLGSQTADQVLRLVARTLLGNVKGRDTAARYGIDEFAILLPGTSLKAGIQVAEILRHAIESKDITDKASNQKLGSITMSIGVAKYREGEDISAFIERAEGALHEAKRGGRNRVRVAVENKASPRAAEN